MHRLFDLLPGFEASTFEGQRFEGLPPWLDQVQIRRRGGLKDELPARIRQIEEEHIHGSIHGEIVQHGVHPIRVFGDPLLHLVEKVKPVDQLPTGVGRGEHLTIGRCHRTKDIARFAAPAIVDLLLGSACWLGFRRYGIHQVLPWIAFDGLGPHFIQTHR